MKLFVLLLLDTTFSRLVFFVTVTCPCSSTTKCHVNFFVYNNNNNNNNKSSQSHCDLGRCPVRESLLCGAITGSLFYMFLRSALECSGEN